MKHHSIHFYTYDDPQKDNFPKEDDKLHDLEASMATSLRLVDVDEVEFSQLGFLVLSL